MSLGLSLSLNKQYDNAIVQTRQALREQIDQLDTLIAKNNLAYYYAQRHKEKPLTEKDKEDALKWANEVYRAYDKTNKDYDRPDFVDTYAFVKATLADSSKEKEEIRKIIAELIGRDEFHKIVTTLNETIRLVE